MRLHLFKGRRTQLGLDLTSKGLVRITFLHRMADCRRRLRTTTPQPPTLPGLIKRIAYFACGTGTRQGTVQGAPATNVLKLLQSLAGEEMRDRGEAERIVSEGGVFRHRQAAKYIHEVGNGDNKLVAALHGMTGSGILPRLIRGHTVLSRHYEPGAQIVLVGFSRRAYTVRALTDWIATNPSSLRTSRKAKDRPSRLQAKCCHALQQAAARAVQLVR